MRMLIKMKYDDIEVMEEVSVSKCSQGLHVLNTTVGLLSVVMILFCKKTYKV